MNYQQHWLLSTPSSRMFFLVSMMPYSCIFSFLFGLLCWFLLPDQYIVVCPSTESLGLSSLCLYPLCYCVLFKYCFYSEHLQIYISSLFLSSGLWSYVFNCLFDITFLMLNTLQTEIVQDKIPTFPKSVHPVICLLYFS